MKSLRNAVLIAALAGIAACGGGSDDPFAVANRIQTLEQCLPANWHKADVLLQTVELWKLQAQPTADPIGLVWNEAAGGAIDLTYVVDACSLDMTITFHAPNGTQQDLDLSGATSLGEAIAAAADQLRDLGGGNSPFMLGVWTVTSATASGSGAITAVIGGTANQNELERLRTTTGVPAGGQPPVQASVVTSADGCELTFRFADLQTDTVVPQDYPIGTIDITVSGPDGTVTGTITFNNTVNAAADIDGVPGFFVINLDTGSVNYQAP